MNRVKKANWKHLYEEWRTSRKTQSEFCKSKGLHYTAFKNGIYRSRNTDKAVGWKSSQSSKFLRLQIPKEQAPYCEIRFGSGSRITIDKPEAVIELGGLIRSLKNA